MRAFGWGQQVQRIREARSLRRIARARAVGWDDYQAGRIEPEHNIGGARHKCWEEGWKAAEAGEARPE